MPHRRCEVGHLPEAVRKAGDKETKGGKMDEIKRRRGKIVYEVENCRGEKDYELDVAEDGTVISNRDDYRAMGAAVRHAMA